MPASMSLALQTVFSHSGKRGSDKGSVLSIVVESLLSTRFSPVWGHGSHRSSPRRQMIFCEQELGAV